ncbi:MAG: exonuclease SbcCD subunit D [Methanosarcinaceae archaeon]|nr:exonuclease SbcCD subunit D [Methanosarcinaceae archaeon]
MSEESIKILHTADTHLGYRQYQSEVRRSDFFDAFRKVVCDAIEMKVDAVVHAGDLFDSRNPSLEDLLGTIKILSELKKHNIPFLGIVGNHESKQNTQWLDLFSGMKLAFRLGTSPFVLNKKNIEAAIYGIDNLSNARFFAYDSFDLEEYESKYETVDTKNILVLHQLLEPIVPGQPLSINDFLEKVSIPVDLVLLGDYHINEVLEIENESGKDIWATYSGSTERCSASEEAPRSYNIVEINKKGIQISKRNIETRPFIIIPIKYDGKGNESSDSVLTHIYDVISEYSEKIPNSVTFVEITGLKKTLISYTEIEEHILNLGANVARVSDKRDTYISDTETETVHVYFQDPDDVVKENIKVMSLTEAGYIMDSVIRDRDIPKSSVDNMSDEKLTTFIKTMDFTKKHKRPEKKIEELLIKDVDEYNEYNMNEIVEIMKNDTEKKISEIETENVAETEMEKNISETEMENVAEAEMENVAEAEMEKNITEIETKKVTETEMKSVAEIETGKSVAEKKHDKGREKPKQYTLSELLGN